MPRQQRGSVAIIAQGPVKNVRREAARYGVHPTSCITVGSSGTNVQCYAPCGPKTNAALDRWFDARTKRRDKAFPPGSLLYLARCRTADGAISGARKSRRRR